MRRHRLPARRPELAYGNTLNYRGLLPDHPQAAQQPGRRRPAALRFRCSCSSPQRVSQLFAHLGIAARRERRPKNGDATNDKASGKLSIVVKSDDKATGSNVVAVLEGKGRKSRSRGVLRAPRPRRPRLDGDAFNGADDNASGTAGLLEIAEAFAKGGPRPERSIVFLSVSGEELGLWGSHWYAEHPTWPLDKIVADVNIDMIGRAPGESDGAIQMQMTPSHQHEKFSTIVRDGVALGAKFGITFTSGDTVLRAQRPLQLRASKGVPVVFFCDGEHPDYHQVTDSADKLDYVRMEAIARLAFWTGWNVAEAKARPKELGKQPSW
jgi:hypothetical protein